MDQDIYVFVKAGIVQYVTVSPEGGKPRPALLAARGEANAKKVMAETPGVSAALIGSVEGETLEGHIALALADGCEGSLMREDDGDRYYPWNRPEPEPVRLTDAQILSIGTDSLLTDQIVGADVLAAVNINGGDREILWKRPMSEVTSRGFPTFVRAITFAFSSKAELRKIKAAIERLKSKDIPPSA